MTNLTSEDIAARIAEVRDEVARIIRKLDARPQAAFAHAVEPVAVSASDVAKMLSIKRDQVYKLHHAGVLNGFRPYPASHLKFLVAEVREVARQMSEERRDA